MTIERIEARARMSRAVVHSDTVYLAGMTADDLSVGTGEQTSAVLAKIDRFLARAGTDKSKLLTAQIWLRDIADFDLMNAVWDKWVDPANPPARATVESRLAGDGYRVEIMVVAAR